MGLAFFASSSLGNPGRLNEREVSLPKEFVSTVKHLEAEDKTGTPR